MATTTTYLGLTKPAGTEPVSIDPLNNNFDKIDAGVLRAMRGKAAHNLLDNSDFAVAQAGYGGKHGNARYACDRWKNTHEYGTFEKVADGLKASYDTNHCYLEQYLPDDVIAHLHGRVYTLAICLSGGVVIVGSSTFNSGATSLHKEYDNLVIEVLKNGVRIVVRSDSATIYWVALYEDEYTADTLPDYVPKGYAAELAECQRYYWAVPSSAQIGYQGYVFTATTARITIPLPTRMRVVPTLSISNLANLEIFSAQGANNSISSVAIGDFSDGMGLSLLVTGTFSVAPCACVLRFNTSVSLSADL